MSVTLNDDKFTQQYFIDMMIRSDFKQADVDDPTGIYELGLPKKDTEDGGKSSAIQKEMVQLANIMRKIKVFKASDKFPQDEWEIIKEMPFAKKSIFINKPRSQPNYSKKVNAKPELVEPLLDEMVHQFDRHSSHSNFTVGNGNARRGTDFSWYSFWYSCSCWNPEKNHTERTYYNEYVASKNNQNKKNHVETQDAHFKTQENTFKTQDAQFKTHDAVKKNAHAHFKTQENTFKTQDAVQKDAHSHSKTQSWYDNYENIKVNL